MFCPRGQILSFPKQYHGATDELGRSLTKFYISVEFSWYRVQLLLNREYGTHCKRPDSEISASLNSIYRILRLSSLPLEAETVTLYDGGRFNSTWFVYCSWDDRGIRIRKSYSPNFLTDHYVDGKPSYGEGSGFNLYMIM
jgi:hypothetical protein